jgi:hypothetical protein
VLLDAVAVALLLLTVLRSVLPHCVLQTTSSARVQAPDIAAETEQRDRGSAASQSPTGRQQTTVITVHLQSLGTAASPLLAALQRARAHKHQQSGPRANKQVSRAYSLALTSPKPQPLAPAYLSKSPDPQLNNPSQGRLQIWQPMPPPHDHRRTRRPLAAAAAPTPPSGPYTHTKHRG